MAVFLASYIFVTLAEMGDKTQLLAMAFAAKYSVFKVLIGVFLATLLNHSLAVAFGRFLSKVIPLDIVSFIAALSFIIFGLWTIRGDKIDKVVAGASPFGPVFTVAIAFFLAEMGDKTQLATVSLSVEYGNAVYVLLGTTLGMISADAIGIVAGIIIRKHLPDRAIKWFAACVFILFGMRGIYKVLSTRMQPVSFWIIIAAVLLLTAFIAYFLFNSCRETE
ncbi:MAG: TMEM165/GDT1 family protein [Candidatus Omnitrophota bacterium]|jgi:putative Ca2+/H+ antiporter (TMEM165/GDT1 family)